MKLIMENWRRFLTESPLYDYEPEKFAELSLFHEDNGDNGEFNELISLHGNARHHKQVVKITESRTSQNGSMLIQDFAEGASFSSFEMSFRLFMGSGSSRPADGFSVSIGNELPERVEFAEEGAGECLGGINHWVVINAFCVLANALC